jgi:hypothetical protein
MPRWTRWSTCWSNWRLWSGLSNGSGRLCCPDAAEAGMKFTDSQRAELQEFCDLLGVEFSETPECFKEVKFAMTQRVTLLPLECREFGIEFHAADVLRSLREVRVRKAHRALQRLVPLVAELGEEPLHSDFKALIEECTAGMIARGPQPELAALLARVAVLKPKVRGLRQRENIKPKFTLEELKVAVEDCGGAGAKQSAVAKVLLLGISDLKTYRKWVRYHAQQRGIEATDYHDCIKALLAKE